MVVLLDGFDDGGSGPGAGDADVEPRGGKRRGERRGTLGVVGQAEDGGARASQAGLAAGIGHAGEDVAELGVEADGGRQQVVLGGPPLLGTQLREDGGGRDAERRVDEHDAAIDWRELLELFADAAHASGGQAAGQERHVGADARQPEQVVARRRVRQPSPRAAESPRCRGIGRTSTEAAPGPDSLVERQAGKIGRSAQAQDEAAPGEIVVADRHAVDALALHAQTAAARQEQKPIGELELHEDAVEQVVPVVTAALDAQRQVQLGRRIEPERHAHSSGPSSPVRHTHSSMLRVCGRRSGVTPHTASAASTASRSTGSSRLRPLWTCLRRWRKPACTTR
jgi:hypothetical protein